MVRLRPQGKHRAKPNYIGYIKSEWRCLVNWWRYFAPHRKH